MEEKQNEYLKNWKQELISENLKLTEQLENANEELVLLRAKKNVLTRIIVAHQGSDFLEDFKFESGYNQLERRIDELEKRLVKSEPEISKKISYNKAIIESITQSL